MTSRVGGGGEKERQKERFFFWPTFDRFSQSTLLKRILSQNLEYNIMLKLK